jgi:murein DD-endopeptidase MepM/ murein hydrolase activator NlpD
MGPGGVPKKATLAGGVGIAFVAIAAYALLGRGDNDGVSVSRTNTPEATATATITPGPTATYTPVPTAAPSVYIPGPEGFVCPAKWTPYECPIVTPDVPGLIAPFPAGTGVEIMCKYVELLRPASGNSLENSTYLLIEAPPNTPVLAPADGAIMGVFESNVITQGRLIYLDANTHQYKMYITLNGDVLVSLGDTVVQGQELGVTSGLPAYPLDSTLGEDLYSLARELEGVSIILGIQRYYANGLLDASSPDLWAGSALSCFPSQ